MLVFPTFPPEVKGFPLWKIEGGTELRQEQQEVMEGLSLLVGSTRPF